MIGVTVEHLIACGLARAEADELYAQLHALATVPDEALRWQMITGRLLTPAVPFAVHELLYQQNYARHRQQNLACPAWKPSMDEAAATHIAQWSSDLGLSCYEELHTWSVTHQEEFANRLARSLSLRFQHPPTHGCDVSAGVENARWYSQASLNIVESCFQADDDALAIIAGDDQNQLEFLTYGQLKALTARVANGLAEYGLAPGDRVAICMPMTVSYTHLTLPTSDLV